MSTSWTTPQFFFILPRCTNRSIPFNLRAEAGLSLTSNVRLWPQQHGPKSNAYSRRIPPQASNSMKDRGFTNEARAPHFRGPKDRIESSFETFLQECAYPIRF